MKKFLKLKNISVVFIIVYVIYTLINQQITINRQRAEIKVNNSELKKIEIARKTLQDEYEMSKTDKYIEKIARERLGLIKEGEIPVIDSSKKK